MFLGKAPMKVVSDRQITWPLKLRGRVGSGEV
jgi:hypothetical protein